MHKYKISWIGVGFVSPILRSHNTQLRMLRVSQIYKVLPFSVHASVVYLDCLIYLEMRLFHGFSTLLQQRNCLCLLLEKLVTIRKYQKSNLLKKSCLLLDSIPSGFVAVESSSLTGSWAGHTRSLLEPRSPHWTDICNLSDFRHTRAAQHRELPSRAQKQIVDNTIWARLYWGLRFAALKRKYTWCRTFGDPSR